MKNSKSDSLINEIKSKLKATLLHELDVSEVIPCEDSMKETLRWAEHYYNETPKTYLAQPYAVNTRFEKAMERLYQHARETYRDETLESETGDAILRSELAFYAVKISGMQMFNENLIETLVLAASVFILDYSEKHREIIDDVMAILDESYGYYKNVPETQEDRIPALNSTTYDPQYVRMLYRIIKYRNREALACSRDETNRRNNELLNSVTAQEKQSGKKYADRDMFDRIMALIPEEIKEKSLQSLREVMKDRMDILMSSTQEMNRGILAKLEELNAAIREQSAACKRFVLDRANEENKIITMVNNKPALITNPLLRNPVSMDDKIKSIQAELMGRPSNGMISMPGSLLARSKAEAEVEKKVRNVNNLHDKLNEMIREKHLQMVSLMMIADSQHLPDFYKKCNDKELPEDMLLLMNPYEIAFALLWALESGLDEPWLGGFTDQVCFLLMNQLPWQYPMSKRYLKASAKDAREDDEETQATQAEISEEDEIGWKTEMYRFERAWQNEKYGTVLDSTATVIYRDTGHLLPADYEPSAEYYKHYLELGYTRHEAFLLSCLVRVYQDMDETRKVFMTHLQEESSKERPDDRQADQELSELKKRCEQLENRAYTAERALRDKQKVYDSLRKEYELEKSELTDLRELVFNLQEPPREDEDSDEENYKFPYEIQKQTLVFGGHKTWLKELRPMLTGNVRFYEDRNTLNFDQRVIANADVIWVQPNAISHSAYYRVVDQARMCDKPVRYFTRASAMSGAKQMVDEDQDRSA